MTTEIKNFIVNYIDSLAQLEILFWFYRFPEQSWTPLMLSNDLRSNVSMTSKVLRVFVQHGLIVLDSDPDFYITTEKFQRNYKLISELYATYLERPSFVISLIYDKSNDKLMGFSDAFKLKKD